VEAKEWLLLTKASNVLIVKAEVLSVVPNVLVLSLRQEDQSAIFLQSESALLCSLVELFCCWWMWRYLQRWQENMNQTPPMKMLEVVWQTSDYYGSPLSFGVAAGVECVVVGL
jgi:ABC-type nickel/cobalt efflux system permease component RcnA